MSSRAVLPVLAVLLVACPKSGSRPLSASLPPDDCSRVLVRDDGRLVACYRSPQRTEGPAELRLYRDGGVPEVVELANGPGPSATHWSFIGKRELLGSTYGGEVSWLIDTDVGSVRQLPSEEPVVATNGVVRTLIKGQLATWDGDRFVPEGSTAPCPRVLAWSMDDGAAMVVCRDTTVWRLGDPNTEGPKLGKRRPYRLIDLPGPGKMFVYEPMTPGWVIDGTSIRPANTKERTAVAPHLPARRRNPTPTGKRDRMLPVFVAPDGRISFPVTGEVARSLSGKWVLRNRDEKGWTLDAIPPELVRSLQPHVEWEDPSLIRPGLRYGIDRDLEQCLAEVDDLQSLDGRRIQTLPVEHRSIADHFTPSIKMEGVPESVDKCLAKLSYEPATLRTEGRLVFE